jgi:hypothetical protein
VSYSGWKFEFRLLLYSGVHVKKWASRQCGNKREASSNSKIRFPIRPLRCDVSCCDAMVACRKEIDHKSKESTPFV